MVRALSLFVVVLGLALPAEASGYMLIDKATAKGDYATVTIGDGVDYPTKFRVFAKARPKQKVEVFWSMTCSKGSGAGSKDGRFTGMSPLLKAIPTLYQSPDYCSFGAAVGLTGEGKRLIAKAFAAT